MSGALRTAAALALAAAAACGREAPPAPAAGPAPPPVPDGLAAPVARRIGQAADEVRAAPGSAGGWGRLGAAFQVHDLPARAIACYERAQALDPRDFRWPYFLGLCLVVGDQRAALEHFRRAAELNDAYAPLQARLGRALFSLEFFDEAEARFRRALELDPTLMRARLGLAGVALEAGDAARAIEQLEEAVHRGAGPEAHRLLAEAHRRAGDLDAAARHLRLGSGGPKFAPLPDPVFARFTWDAGATLRAHRDRAEAHRMAGRLDDAVAEWRRAAADYPESPEPRAQLARLHARQGRLDRAEAEYEAALQLDPAYAGARAGLSALLIARGRAEEGLAQLRRACELAPDGAEVRLRLARALAGLQRFEEAAEAYAAAMQRSPGGPAAPREYAELLRGLGRCAEGIELLRAARAAHPGDPALLAALAWDLATCPGDAARDGAEALSIARSLCPAPCRDLVLLDTLAAAHAETGDFEAAIGAAQKAVDLALDPDPANPVPPEQWERVERVRRRLALYRAGRPYRDY